MDRDTKHCEGFRSLLEHAGVRCVRLPPRSPNLTPHIERFMRSIKEECLRQLIFFGEPSLRRAVAAYTEHYHHERNHQGLANRIPFPDVGVVTPDGRIRRRDRLGGLLRYYYRDAA